MIVKKMWSWFSKATNEMKQNYSLYKNWQVFWNGVSSVIPFYKQNNLNNKCISIYQVTLVIFHQSYAHLHIHIYTTQMKIYNTE
jgi:hypothetical protein